jgi:hypothetical protein
LEAGASEASSQAFGALNELPVGQGASCLAFDHRRLRAKFACCAEHGIAHGTGRRFDVRPRTAKDHDFGTEDTDLGPNLGRNDRQVNKFGQNLWLNDAGPELTMHYVSGNEIPVV